MMLGARERCLQRTHSAPDVPGSEMTCRWLERCSRSRLRYDQLQGSMAMSCDVFVICTSS
jgi:hypothetical protein